MLIEKLRCKSIYLLSSHFAALNVNITPEENVHSFSCFLSSSSSVSLHFLCVVMVTWCDKEKKKINTVLLCFSTIKSCHDVAYSHCVSHWRSRFSFIARRQSCRHRGPAGCVFVVMLSLWNELCGPVSAEKSQSTPLKLFLMQKEVTAWDQAQG